MRDKAIALTCGIASRSILCDTQRIIAHSIHHKAIACTSARPQISILRIEGLHQGIGKSHAIEQSHGIAIDRSCSRTWRIFITMIISLQCVWASKGSIHVNQNFGSRAGATPDPNLVHVPRK